MRSLDVDVHRQVGRVGWCYDVDQKAVFTLYRCPVSAVSSGRHVQTARFHDNVCSSETYRPCIQAGPYAVAFMTCPSLTFTGCGGCHRLTPDVSSAYGTPSHFLSSTSVVLTSRKPCSRPEVVWTRRSFVAGAEIAATTRNAVSSTQPRITRRRENPMSEHLGLAGVDDGPSQMHAHMRTDAVRSQVGRSEPI